MLVTTGASSTEVTGEAGSVAGAVALGTSVFFVSLLLLILLVAPLTSWVMRRTNGEDERLGGVLVLTGCVAVVGAAAAATMQCILLLVYRVDNIIVCHTYLFHHAIQESQ